MRCKHSYFRVIVVIVAALLVFCLFWILGFIFLSFPSYLHFETYLTLLDYVIVPSAIILLFSLAILFFMRFGASKIVHRLAVTVTAIAIVFSLTATCVVVSAVQSPYIKQRNLRNITYNTEKILVSNGMTPYKQGRCGWLESATWEEFYTMTGATVRASYHSCAMQCITNKFYGLFQGSYHGAETKRYFDYNETQITEWFFCSETNKLAERQKSVGITIKKGNDILLIEIHGREKAVDSIYELISSSIGDGSPIDN